MPTSRASIFSVVIAVVALIVTIEETAKRLMALQLKGHGGYLAVLRWTELTVYVISSALLRKARKWLIPSLWLQIGRRGWADPARSLLSHSSPQQCPQLPSPELLGPAWGWLRSLWRPSVSMGLPPAGPHSNLNCFLCIRAAFHACGQLQRGGFADFLVWLTPK